MLRYFKTQSGKKLVFYLAGTTTVGLFLTNYLPNTLGLQHYKNFHQCYRYGFMQLTINIEIKLNFTEIKLFRV